MAEETIDPGLLEQTKNQIRKLVAEIAELAESDIQPAEFHNEFLNRVIAAVAASGGALWLMDGGRNLRLQHQVEFAQSGLMNNRQFAQPHDGLLSCMMQATGAQIIPPGASVDGVPGAGNPTQFSLILAPLVLDKQVVGLVEVLMDPHRRAASQKSTQRFISDLCDLAGTYLKNRQVRQMMSQQKLWNQLEQYDLAIHNSLDLRETAYAIANEGKRLVGCDRLSVAMKIGGRMLIEAVSGQEVVEQRSNLVREMTKLCKAVVQSGEDLVYSGHTEGFPPDIRDALEIFVDESGAKSLVVTLLHKPDTPANQEKVPYGCLLAEQIGDESAPTDMHARTEVVSRHASSALWNSSEYDKIFLRPVLKAIGTPSRFFRGRTLAKILGVLGVLLAGILIMAFVPWELSIEGRGSLWPESRRTVFAPHEGIISQVAVDHLDQVKKGDLLFKLNSKELDKKMLELVAQQADASAAILNLNSQYNKSSKPEEKQQLKGEIDQGRYKLESAEKQIEILKEELAMMEVRSPIDGVLTSWEVKKNFTNRPVAVGQEIVQVADPANDWVLEVEVNDNDMAPILAAQQKLERDIKSGAKPKDARLGAWFVTATDPEHRYEGYVRRIAGKADTVEGKHVVKVTVGFDDKVRKDFLSKNQDLRPGSEVRARVKCGKAKLAYVLFRDVIHVWHESVMFRWPFLR